MTFSSYLIKSGKYQYDSPLLILILDTCWGGSRQVSLPAPTFPYRTVWKRVPRPSPTLGDGELQSLSVRAELGFLFESQPPVFLIFSSFPYPHLSSLPKSSFEVFLPMFDLFSSDLDTLGFLLSLHTLLFFLKEVFLSWLCRWPLFWHTLREKVLWTNTHGKHSLLTPSQRLGAHTSIIKGLAIKRPV